MLFRSTIASYTDGSHLTLTDTSLSGTGLSYKQIVSFGTCSTSATVTCNEGTAMMEIIYDLASGVTLGMGDVSTSADFITRVTDLTNWGAKVIVDDVGFYGEPYFENGTVGAAYANAIGNGIVMVSAAGNDAQKHYQASFADFFDGTNHWQNFGGGTPDRYMPFTVPAGKSATVILQWTNLFDQAFDDYDLFIYDNTNAQVAS